VCRGPRPPPHWDAPVLYCSSGMLAIAAPRRVAAISLCDGETWNRHDHAAISLPAQETPKSERARMCVLRLARTPNATAVLIESVTMLPFRDPWTRTARPARSRTPPVPGAAASVLDRVTARGATGPAPETCSYSAIFAWRTKRPAGLCRTTGHQRVRVQVAAPVDTGKQRCALGQGYQEPA